MPVMMNKCIGTCAYMGGIPALLEEFVWSWSQMLQWNYEYLCGPGEYVHYDRERVSVHDVARNLMAERMRGDWLVMFDTDHQFEPDIVARLLRVSNEYDADVVAGFYQFRHPPYSPNLYLKTDLGLSPIADWDRSLSAMEIDSSGAGCLFVRRAVYDRIKDELSEMPFDRIQGYGEDHSFFLRLKTLGIKAVCDPKVQCHHLQTRAVTLDDYDPARLDTRRLELKGYA